MSNNRASSVNKNAAQKKTGAQKAAPAKQQAVQKPAEIKAAPKHSFEAAWKYIFPVLAFLSILAQSRFMAIALAAVFAIFFFGKSSRINLRRRLAPLTLFVALYAALCLVAGLYSDFGSSSVNESAKILSALALFFIVLAKAKDGDEKQILSVVAVITAIISFLCIDASTLVVFTKLFALIMKPLFYKYDLTTMGYEQGIRITGIFGSANVSAGIISFGIIIGLYLVSTYENERKRFASFVLLGVNALAFMLSFSMGAIAAFLLACAILLAACGKERRFPMFFLMLETAFVTVLFSFLAIPFLGNSDITGAIPLLSSLLCGPSVWVLDHYVKKPALKLVAGKGKAIAISCGTLVLAVVVYLVLAFNITNGSSLSAEEKLSRAEHLAAGQYKISTDYNGDADLQVYSQNYAELMMHTNTVLYNGAPDDANFTVPQDSRIVWFVITAKNAARLDSITLSNGLAVKLNYPLLPEIVANRLQGLSANQNFIQRLVFFEDGIKLFEQSPIFGSGLGGVEGRLTSVQSFYYETLYIHNHFIQVMDEMGLLGLAVFVLMLVFAALLLWKARKSKSDPLLVAAFAACIVMIIVHSAAEVVWSIGSYQSIVFLIFAAMIITYGKPLKKITIKKNGTLVLAALCAVVVGFGILIGGNFAASGLRLNFKATDRADVISTMRRLELMDVYDDESYMSTYIQNALLSDNSKELSIAADYAKRLRAADEYTACTDVAMYYYFPNGRVDKMFDASRAAIAQEASNKDAWNLQLDFYRQAFSALPVEYMDEYLQGVMTTLDYLEKYNIGRMEEIAIKEEHKPFIDCVKQLAASGASNEEIKTALSVFAK